MHPGEEYLAAPSRGAVLFLRWARNNESNWKLITFGANLSWLVQHCRYTWLVKRSMDSFGKIRPCDPGAGSAQNSWSCREVVRNPHQAVLEADCKDVAVFSLTAISHSVLSMQCWLLCGHSHSWGTLRGCAERSEAVVSSQTRQCPSPAAQWRVHDRMALMPWGVSGWLYDTPTPTWPLSPAHPKAIKAGEKTGGGIFSSCLPGAWSVCREFQSNTSKGCFFFLFSSSFFPRLFLKINSNEIKIFTCWICCLLLKKALK